MTSTISNIGRNHWTGSVASTIGVGAKSTIAASASPESWKRRIVRGGMIPGTLTAK